MIARRLLFLFALCAASWPARGEWPQFRGPEAAGVDETTPLPTAWNLATGENLLWQTPIAGLAHSSPIAWGDRIYVATAVAQDRVEIKVGLYGDPTPANDNGSQQWHLLALEAATGKVIWDRQALEAIPRDERHMKATHCNSTPATDGHRIVATFDAEGVFCFDTDGKMLWQKDLGITNSRSFPSPTAHWGFASSPIISQGKVIIQCDVQENSYLAVLDLEDGHELWRTPRQDSPTWSTPAVITDGAAQIVVNGYHETAGYSFTDGQKLWTLDGGGDVPVPTPIFSHGLIYLTSGHGQWRPMRAVRPMADGDITPADPGQTNDFIAWAAGRLGNYMQTPLVVGDFLYGCNDLGVVTCFEAKTGVVRYGERLTRKGEGFTSSPVSDGRHLYFASELGNVFIIPAGDKFVEPTPQPLGETAMASPAIHQGMLLYRTRDRVLALKQGAKSASLPPAAGG